DDPDLLRGCDRREQCARGCDAQEHLGPTSNHRLRLTSPGCTPPELSRRPERFCTQPGGEGTVRTAAAPLRAGRPTARAPPPSLRARAPIIAGTPGRCASCTPVAVRPPPLGVPAVAGARDRGGEPARPGATRCASRPPREATRPCRLAGFRYDVTYMEPPADRAETD